MKFAAVAFVALAGMLAIVQSGANAQMVRTLERPWTVGLIVSLVTTAAFAVGVALAREGVPEMGRLAAAPWWAWVGGLCGAATVVATLFFAQRLGAGVFTGLTVTAGIATSLLLDHFGLVGFEVHPAGLWRIAGAGLMVAGLALVAAF
jgi:transporter family-2 protein